MITRKIEIILKNLAKNYPVVTITGPRQSGKTTLCKMAFPDKEYVNLENLDIREFATEDPRGFLKRYSNGAIIDEIQRAPDILSYIQGIVDERQEKGLFILTGSQNFAVANAINQSLAGRTALLKLLPFSIDELTGKYEVPEVDDLILKGLYPRIHDDDLNPTTTLSDYFETYVERDLRSLIHIRELGLFQRFVKLCAGRTGQMLNLNSLANDAGISHTTARSWLTLLEASYIVFLLQPYWANVSKRLVKSPKLYFYDVGLATCLLGLENTGQISRDPLRGYLVENLVVTEALKYRYNRGKRSNLHFYRDNIGNEVDLVLTLGHDLFPIEIKSGGTVTKDYFKGLKNFSKVFDTPYGSGLVYGGDDVQERNDILIYPIKEVHALMEKTESFSS